MSKPLSLHSLKNLQRRWLILLGLAAAGGCGGERQQQASEKSAEQLTREIEAVAELKPPVKEGDLPISLVPLKRADLAELSPGPIACFLFRGEKIYLATTGADAVLRINGRLTHVLAGGPVGPTGGFFTGRDTRVSIGRTGKYAGRAADYVPGWLAEVAVRAGRDAMAQYAVGKWTCRRQGRAAA